MLAALLTACAAPPIPPARPVPMATVPNRITLQPLTPQLTSPPDAPPRSTVAAVNYDLMVPGTGTWLPDDGVPGDEAPSEVLEQGGASWYGIQFHQRKTASGERFDMTALTAAHRTLPFGAHVCVKSLVNGREVMVRINDRGPYAAGRIIDLSRAAADSIGMLGLGIKQVSLSRVNLGERCGDVVSKGDDEPAPLVAAPVRRAAHPRSAAKTKVRQSAVKPAAKRIAPDRSD